MRQRHSALLLILILGLSASVLVSAKKKPAASHQMDEQKRALHALNRLTFGPRPGEVERVAALGVDKWIEQQLRPEKIDDHAVEARLASFTTLRMSTREMVEKFPPPQVVKQVAEGKKSMPRDPKERAIYESQVDAYRDRQERKQAKGDQDPNASSANDDQRAGLRQSRMEADAKAEELLDLPPEERFQEILKMSPEERRMLVRGLKQEDRQRVMQEFTPQQRETVMAMVSPQMVITTELQQAKILRAAYSERQLDEVMTDFWFNHFNVFMGKGPDRYLLTAYERDVIRPHAMGKFKDLLEATAKSPAMLFYLDNWLSVGPHSDVALGRPRQRAYRPVRRGPFGVPRPGGPPRPQNPNAQQQKKNKREGLNENYARELMELHTLSVNGGYTQRDVTELAKVFTGWTIKRPRQGGGFEFNQRLHEPGPKYVLGKVIKEHGEKEGEKVLDMLAKSPKTAHFISYKLAQRFVSDEPPLALVDRMAETFLKKDGDIREVLRTLFQSPEFWSPGAYRAKVKTPLEFVVSAVRASGVDVENAMPLVQSLNRMGMPLYGAQPPTGYSMKAETWVNSAALLSRMNFALALGTGRMRGLSFDADRILPGGKTPQDRTGALAALETSLLAGDVSKNTHDTILKQMDDPQVTGMRLDDPARPPNVGVLAGLLMGSPEFQRR